MPLVASLALGMAGALAVFAYALLAAHADGRHLWLGYPFMVPLAALMIDQGLKRKARLSQPFHPGRTATSRPNTKSGATGASSTARLSPRNTKPSAPQ